MAASALIILLSLIGPHPERAKAEQTEFCPLMVEPIRGKLKELDTYHDFTERQSLRVEDTASECELRGAEITKRLSGMVQGLTCTSLEEASKLDLELTNLGKECHGKFSDIDNFQGDLRENFESARDGLYDGLKLMKASPVLQEPCRDAIRISEKMQRSFRSLDADFTALSARITQAKSSFGSFETTAGNLHQLTAQAASHCGVADSAVMVAQLKQGPASTGPNRAGHVPEKKGSPPGSPSTVTGEIHRDDLESMSAGSKSAGRPKPAITSDDIQTAAAKVAASGKGEPAPVATAPAETVKVLRAAIAEVAALPKAESSPAGQAKPVVAVLEANAQNRQGSASATVPDSKKQASEINRNPASVSIEVAGSALANSKVGSTVPAPDGEGSIQPLEGVVRVSSFATPTENSSFVAGATSGGFAVNPGPSSAPAPVRIVEVSVGSLGSGASADDSVSLFDRVRSRYRATALFRHSSAAGAATVASTAH